MGSRGIDHCSTNCDPILEKRIDDTSCHPMLEKRIHDAKETFERRYNEFLTKYAPLLDRYECRGILECFVLIRRLPRTRHYFFSGVCFNPVPDTRLLSQYVLIWSL